MKNILVAAAAAVALSACASAPPPVVLTSTFSPAEVAWFNQTGTGSIKASALLRQMAGGVVTCAGKEMTLIPVSAYANERMYAIYKSNSRGYYQLRTLFGTVVHSVTLPEAPAAYRSTSKEKICDPQGFATFTNLPDGEYYVTTEVTWGVPSGPYGTVDMQGGALMQRVEIQNGEAAEIVLTN